MFKLKIKAKDLKGLITAISPIIEEAVFLFTPKGLMLRGLDPSRVTLVDLGCSVKTFDVYKCDEDTHLMIVVSEFLKFIKNVGTEDVAELSFNPKVDSRLMLSIKSKYKTSYKIPTETPKIENYPKPNVTFSVEGKFVTSDLSSAFEKLSALSDHALLQGSQNKLLITSKGELGKEGETEFVKESESVINWKCPSDVIGEYALAFVNPIMKACLSFSDIVTMKYDINKPLQLTFQVPQKIRLIFWVAPRTIKKV